MAERALEEIPKVIGISFVNDRAWLSFDNTFCVPLDRKALQEVRDYCDRAIAIFDEYK